VNGLNRLDKTFREYSLGQGQQAVYMVKAFTLMPGCWSSSSFVGSSYIGCHQICIGLDISL